MRKTVEALLRQKNLTHAQRNEILKWETVLDELDHEDELNERRHSEKRDLLDLGLMECENSEEYIATKILLRICRSDTGWNGFSPKNVLTCISLSAVNVSLPP